MVVDRREMDLALAGEPPPRARVLDAIEVTFEAQPELVRLLRNEAVSRAPRSRRAGSEQHILLRLAFLTTAYRRPDDSSDAGVRPTDHDVPNHDVPNHDVSDSEILQEFAHTVSVTAGYDTYLRRDRDAAM
jgi:hypothetical protein